MAWVVPQFLYGRYRIKNQNLLVMISALVLEGKVRYEWVPHAELMKLLCSFP